MLHSAYGRLLQYVDKHMAPVDLTRQVGLPRCEGKPHEKNCQVSAHVPYMDAAS